MLHYQCPHCRSHRIYKTPFRIHQALDMYAECPHCRQNFNPEPGFYYGAMFISYGLSGILLLGTGLILVFGFGMGVNRAMLVVLLLGALSFFKILRLSRSIWLHINVRYNVAAAKSLKH